MDTQKLADLKLECMRIASQYSKEINELLTNTELLFESLTKGI